MQGVGSRVGGQTGVSRVHGDEDPKGEDELDELSLELELRYLFSDLRFEAVSCKAASICICI